MVQKSNTKHKDDEKNEVDESLFFNFPKTNKKIELKVKRYEFMSEKKGAKSQSTRIGSEAVEFRSPKDFEVGTLLKISISIPDYWDRKQQFVNYSRVDEPSELSILAKVIKSTKSGKRSRNRMVVAKTVNISEEDEKLLEEYLKNG